MGKPRAVELLLTPRVLNEALEWVLVTEVHDDDPSHRRREELAQSLATGPTFALGQAKRLVRTAWDSTRADVGQAEARVIAQAVADPEAEQRIDAFVRR